ncbi:MAG: hypothetical protein AVDCRST_MAG89-187, partial [uncultured Gemmatimonadetes bacterium]
ERDEVAGAGPGARPCRADDGGAGGGWRDSPVPPPAPPPPQPRRGRGRGDRPRGAHPGNVPGPVRAPLAVGPHARARVAVEQARPVGRARDGVGGLRRNGGRGVHARQPPAPPAGPAVRPAGARRRRRPPGLDDRQGGI